MFFSFCTTVLYMDDECGQSRNSRREGDGKSKKIIELYCTVKKLLRITLKRIHNLINVANIFDKDDHSRIINRPNKFTRVDIEHLNIYHHFCCNIIWLPYDQNMLYFSLILICFTNKMNDAK